MFAARQLPSEIPQVTIRSDEPVWIVQVIRECGFAASNGEGRRFIQQGAVSVDGEKVSAVDATLPNDDRARVLRVGKRRFARVIVGC